ncbi:negative cofactor 2 transcription regulator complex subunit ncb2 [Dimargaris verticillata]|uniref:Negative cofactor 2 transcription regulator complex subunit ncb2 n=1 Tax=Dimargaris verticillata TaxID=2761393 RepID=A0A9W8EBU6_9FUNG|nr:negative cofactor 2 transcription regulator complex subunit ncb2 [Dimargaris verticillata]
MSDFENSGGGGGGGDDELSLPRATVHKLIQEMMPKDISCAKETRDLLIDCCNEFIHLIASEANEICEKEAKKTIAAEHVLNALKTLGFESYLTEVQDVYEDHRKQQSKDRDKRNARFDSGLTEEELLRQQEQLFAQARLDYETQQQQQPPPPPPQ